MGWKEDVSRTGEIVLRLVKLEKNSNQVNAKYIYRFFLQIWSNVVFSVLS